MKAIVTSFLLATTLMLTPVMPTAAANTADDVATVADFNEFAELVDYATYGEMAEYAAVAGCPRGTYKVRKHTRTKKKVVNSLIAGGVGAAVGGGLGGCWRCSWRWTRRRTWSPLGCRYRCRQLSYVQVCKGPTRTLRSQVLVSSISKFSLSGGPTYLGSPFSHVARGNWVDRLRSPVVRCAYENPTYRHGPRGRGHVCLHETLSERSGAIYKCDHPQNR
jgi:hypothetical protein